MFQPQVALRSMPIIAPIWAIIMVGLSLLKQIINYIG